MNAQLKYGFKKEMALFFRRKIFMGTGLAFLGFALGYPLMYKLIAVLFQNMPDNFNDLVAMLTASIGGRAASMDSDTISNIGSMYDSARTTYTLTLTSVLSYVLLVAMLVMRSPAGGEQKKRAMMVPMCCGLKTTNYLLPKFVIYPCAMFIMTFVSGVMAGVLSNALFEIDRVDISLIFLGSFLSAIYMVFAISVYLSLGICTQRPGLITGAVFVGQMIIQIILNSLNLTDYHPFTLLNMAGGEIFTDGYDFSAKTGSIVVACVLSLVIAVLMFFLALGIMNAKEINNQDEIKPEF